MKILHITSQAPDTKSGGSLGVYQSAYSLLSLGAEVDYIGPPIENEELKEKYNNLYELNTTKNKLLRVWDCIFLNTNSRYREWVKLPIIFKEYDFVFLDFTKLDYVVKKINGLVPIITRVHNVEKDYSEKEYLYGKGISTFITYKLAQKREKYIVKNSHKLLVLTQNDKEALKTYYKVSSDKMEIVPVCINNTKTFEEIDNKEQLTLIITGSLWFGPNANGVKWIIQKVLPLLKIKYHLIIAGFRPNEEIKKMCSLNKNVTLVDSPESMAPYFLQAELVLVPVFDGAGMKVKVAEALSYGKVIVSTSHGIIGYHIENGINAYVADNETQFSDCINRYYHLEAFDKKNMQQLAHKVYLKNNSLDACVNLYKKVINEVMV